MRMNLISKVIFIRARREWRRPRDGEEMERGKKRTGALRIEIAKYREELKWGTKMR